MNQNLLLEELTRGVCKIAKQAGAYIREERRKFSLESVERVNMRTTMCRMWIKGRKSRL